MMCNYSRYDDDDEDYDGKRISLMMKITKMITMMINMTMNLSAHATKTRK